MSYQVAIPKPVQKQLDSLPDSVRDRIIKQIAMLKERPRPRGCVKLKGYESEGLPKNNLLNSCHSSIREIRDKIGRRDHEWHE